MVGLFIAVYVTIKPILNHLKNNKLWLGDKRQAGEGEIKFI